MITAEDEADGDNVIASQRGEGDVLEVGDQKKRMSESISSQWWMAALGAVVWAQEAALVVVV